MFIVFTLLLVVFSGLLFRATAEFIKKKTQGFCIDPEMFQISISGFITAKQWNRIQLIAKVYENDVSPIMVAISKIVDHRNSSDEIKMIIDTAVQNAKDILTRFPVLPQRYYIAILFYGFFMTFILVASGMQEGWVIGPFVLGSMWNIYWIFEFISTRIVARESLKEEFVREFLDTFSKAVLASVATETQESSSPLERKLEHLLSQLQRSQR